MVYLEKSHDLSTQFISGSNTIDFRVASEFEVMQLDLFANMNIDKIMLDEAIPATFTREYNAVLVRLPKKLLEVMHISILRVFILIKNIILDF